MLPVTKLTPETVIQVTERVWLTKPRPGESRQYVNVCLRMEDGSFAGFYFLEVDDKGVYRDGDIEIGTLEAPCFIEYINKISKSPAEDEKEIFASVCSVYEGNKSIKKTAQLLSISEERVRRILITEGLYTCALHKQISELLNQGKPIDEIADILKMKPKNIRTYLPYDKGFESSL